MKALLTAILLAAVPAAALAQQAPAPALLQASAAKQIGSFWSPVQFRVVAKQFTQNPLKPSFVVRFQMDATNPAALYVLDGNKVGPAAVLAMTVPAKTTRTFYGTEDLTYSAGAWTGPTTIENPAAKLGKPIDFYTVPTLVLGSGQYKSAVAQQMAFSLDQRKAQFQKQLDALEKADAAKVAAIEQSFGAGLQGVNSAFTDKLTQQQAALTARLATLLTKSRQALAEQEKAVEKAWADVIAQQHDALAKLDLGLQTTQQAVAAKIKLAQATIDSQKQLIALQQQALADNATIASLKSKLAEKAKAQLVAFEGTWTGALRCDAKQNPWGVHASEITLALPKQTGGMLSGQMTVTAGDLTPQGGWRTLPINKPIQASLQITNMSGNGPLRLSVLTAGTTVPEKRFLNFAVQLEPSGSLSGHLTDVSPACSVIFSR
ncbi:MAG: hypothetical protein KGL52_08405 [Rhodospirillales bacterium]|nr:hypothetical protein [Rhodospirillales bacterium]